MGTIYKGFGVKPGLVRAIIEKGLAGDVTLPAAQRSDRIRDSDVVHISPGTRRLIDLGGTLAQPLAGRRRAGQADPAHSPAGCPLQ